MSKKSALKLSALAIAIATAAPMTATAEVSGSLDIASQYLWRGQTLTTAPTVSGSLDYEHSSGLYAGIWTSSEAIGVEYDLYAGFAGEAGDFSYDVGVIFYRYSAGGEPRDPDGEGRIKDANFQDIYVGLGFGDFSLEAFIGFDKTGDGADYKDNYFALGYSFDKFGVMLGYADLEDSTGNYANLDLSYEVIENLTFTASTIVWEDTDNTYAKEPTFVVSYSFPF
jgi:uncharacterized protein (TIGR02001 family)